MTNYSITVLFAFMVVFGLTNCTSAVSNQTSMSDSAVNQHLSEVAKEMNKKCPMPVDDNTRMDSASVYNSFMITYHYTVHNVINKEVNLKTFKASMENAMTLKYKSDPRLAVYRDNNIAIAYDYKDMAGGFLCYFICDEK
jgi:hypothetical protein